MTLQFYPGASWQPDSGKVSGIIYKEVWNKEGEMVFEPEDSNVRVLVTGITEADISGKKVTVSGSVCQPEGERNPGGYSEKKYLYGKNVMLIMSTTEIEVNEDSLSVRAVGARIRNLIDNAIGNLLEDKYKGFLSGVMTGDTSALQQGEKQWIRLSGISHLMAVSGMHVTYILMPVKALVKRRSLDITLRSGICLIPLFIFVMIAGFSASVVRAGVMCAADLISKIANRRNDTLNSLGFAGCVCLIIYPFAVADIGFVLSFGAVLSGITVLPAIKRLVYRNGREPIKKFEGILYGISVNIGLLPVMMYNFNMISVAGLLITVIAAPLSAVMCIFGYVMVVVYYIPVIGEISRLFAAGLTAVTSALSFISETGSEIPVLYTVSPGVFFFALYYGALAWLCCRNKRKYFNRRTISAVLAVVIFGALVSDFINNDLLTVSWLDVGQGSCAIIETRSGSTILVDGGNGYTDVSNLLWKKGIRTLDWVILSHGDSDHVSGLYKVLEQHPAKKLIIPDNSQDEGALKLARLATGKGTDVIEISGKAHFTVDNLSVELFCNTEKDSLNNSSVVVQLTADNSSFLLPGDLEVEGEDYLTEQNFLRQCRVITASHHGSKSGTGDMILSATNPQVAVISVGEGNMYGHPHKDVLKRLENAGTYVFRTDRDGAVIMTLNDKDIIGFETWLKKASIQFRK